MLEHVLAILPTAKAAKAGDGFQQELPVEIVGVGQDSVTNVILKTHSDALPKVLAVLNKQGHAVQEAQKDAHRLADGVAYVNLAH